MTILTIVGARPQFIKAAPVTRALCGRHRQILLHTGQHYDDPMSGQFFRELDLPAADRDLGVGSGPHGAQTAAMLTGIESAITEWRPDVVLVYGDTNSTLAGALAAAKLHVPVAHVEAGLRSRNRRMPEEINRVVADHVSTRLFCPSRAAAENLAREGITSGVHVVGDVMLDQIQWAAARASTSRALDRFGAEPGQYALATIHRAETVDDAGRLAAVAGALNELQDRVIFPVHPRTARALRAIGFRPSGRVSMIDPIGYVDMVRLQQSARVIVTDSGGVQKEAFWLGVPCVTVRDETEWVETVRSGWNVLAGTDPARIVSAARDIVAPAEHPAEYGEPGAAARIVELLG
jgi:UDP-N-acetylglucosamine 2-epimerase